MGDSAARIVLVMLFVQVVLGGGSTVLRFPAGYHLIWGTTSFIALVVATTLLARDYGIRSTPSLVAVGAVVDFIFQGLLGLASYGSAIAIVVHLTNAFVLVALVTWVVVDTGRRGNRSLVTSPQS